MAGVDPHPPVWRVGTTAESGAQKEVLVLLIGVASGGTEVRLVIEAARRGWPGQAWSSPAITMRRGRRLRLALKGSGLRRRLPAEHAAAPIAMREPQFFGDHILDRQRGRAALDATGLVVEPLERGEAIVFAQLRFLNRRLHTPDRLVIYF